MEFTALQAGDYQLGVARTTVLSKFFFKKKKEIQKTSLPWLESEVLGINEVNLSGQSRSVAIFQFSGNINKKGF